MGALALVTDGGGSIRNPASFTNLCGLKPTFGRVPAYPPNPVGTLANVGPMARTVSDLALMLTVISRPDPRDWLSLPYEPHRLSGRARRRYAKGLRVAFSPDLGFASVDPEIAAHVSAAARRFEDLGAHTSTRLIQGIGDVTQIFDIHWQVGVANALGKAPPEALALLDPGLDKFVLAGSRVQLTDFLEAQNARIAAGQKMRLFHQRYDLLILPTLAVPAFPGRSARATGCRRRRFRRLDPVFLSVQPHPAAGPLRPLRLYRGRLADRAPDRWSHVPGRPRPAGGARLRTGGPPVRQASSRLTVRGMLPIAVTHDLVFIERGA